MEMTGDQAAGMAAARTPLVRRTTDRDEVRRLLETARPVAAPVYAYLEDRYLPHAHWHIATAGGQPALLCWVEGSPGANLYVQGAGEPLAALLRQVDVPRYSFLLFEQGNEALVRRHFLLRDLQRLMRMRVDRNGFTPATPHPNGGGQATGPVRLAAGDIAAVNTLYRSDSGARLTREYLSGGVYYGMWEGDRLMSVAGTQLFQPSHSIAVVANVMTHPSRRGRGYATQCVGAVTQHLLEVAPDVVLNVDPRNQPAVHSYQRLGYRHAGDIGEAWAWWRGRTWFDRLSAHLMHWIMG